MLSLPTLKIQPLIPEDLVACCFYPLHLEGRSEAGELALKIHTPFKVVSQQLLLSCQGHWLPWIYQISWKRSSLRHAHLEARPERERFFGAQRHTTSPPSGLRSRPKRPSLSGSLQATGLVAAEGLLDAKSPGPMTAEAGG
ncbi:hypothetical protein AB1E18_018553 [Capra hircus]